MSNARTLRSHVMRFVALMISSSLSFDGCAHESDEEGWGEPSREGAPPASAPVEAEPDPELTRRVVCTRDAACSEAHDVCIEEREADCNQCYRSAYEPSDCWRVCDLDLQCDGVDDCRGRTCISYGERFSPAERSAAIFEACMAAAARDASCGLPSSAERDCEVFARREGSWVVPVYQCIAATACGASTSSCAASLPRMELAEHVCLNVRLSCGSCDETSREWGEINDGWLKPAYVHALYECLNIHWCEGMRECLADLDAATSPR